MPEPPEFLGLLYPEIPEGAALLLWTLPDRISYWYSGDDATAQAHARAVELSAAGQEVYFGTGLGPPGLGARERAKACQVTGLYGLAADLDLATGAHKKGGLFRSVDEIRAFLSALVIRPTGLVLTGGGVHAHWCFKEPWIFGEGSRTVEEDRREAAAIARGWVGFLRMLARKNGREIDATQDLSRVLRVPGTTNQKYGKLVEIIEWEDTRRADPSEFESWRQDEAFIATQIVVDEITLDPNAKVDHAKLEALLDVDLKYKQTWLRRRRDMADTSPSAYDLALANMAASCGWSDQEIADLIISWRRTHGVDLKLRADYYRGTIAKAREKCNAAAIDSDILNLPVPEQPGPERDAVRAELLALVRTKTDLPVQRIIRYGREKPEYCLVLDDAPEPISLGGVDAFAEWKGWRRAALLGEVGPPSPLSGKEWHIVLCAAQKLVELQDAPETSSQGILAGWLHEIARRRITVSNGDPETRFRAVQRGSAFTEGGRFYFRLDRLYDHVKNMAREKVTRTEILRRLVQAGARKEQQIQCWYEGKRVTGRYWSVPDVEGFGIQAPVATAADTLNATADLVNQPDRRDKQSRRPYVPETPATPPTNRIPAGFTNTADLERIPEAEAELAVSKAVRGPHHPCLQN